MSDPLTDRIAPITVIQTGRVDEIDFEPGMTIAGALRQVGISTAKGQELRLNNQPISDYDTELKPGDQLLSVGQISGG
jgi:hypothetical protein